MNAIDGILSVLKSLSKRISSLEAQSIPRWVFLTTPLTSTSWDGDSYSTTAKTKIDLSAVFSAPAGIKAVLVAVSIRDSGSSGSDCELVLAPNNTAGSGLSFRCSGQADDSWSSQIGVIPCDSNGDIYYQITASGASTLEAHIGIWGYEI